jgi:hypothetical protein
MSFAILRHGKISSTSRGAAIGHNHRLGNVDQVNIDKDMKHLNRCFMGEGLAARIDALLPEKIRKDAVVSMELLLTSGPEFFNEIEKDRAKLSKNPRFLDWVQKTLDWAKKEFGSNLVDATLHMDESTPHMHLMAVPLTKDGRLCAKELMARPELQRRQTEYAKSMEPFGLKRGDPAAETKRRHIGLKENPSSGGKAAQLEAQLAKVKADLARLQKLSKEWSDRDLAKVKALETKLASLSAELTQSKTKEVTLTNENKALTDDLEATKARFAAMAEDYEAYKAQGKTPALFVPEEAQEGHQKAQEGHQKAQEGHQKAQEGHQKAQEAFDRQWGACEVREVSRASYGTLMDVCGQQAVYRIRGVPYLCTYPEGTKPPSLTQQTEQQKGGIAR